MSTPVCAVLWDQPRLASGAVPAGGLLYMGAPLLQRGESEMAIRLMVYLSVNCQVLLSLNFWWAAVTLYVRINLSSGIRNACFKRTQDAITSILMR